MKFVGVLGLLVCLPGSWLPAAGADAVHGIFGALAFEENRGQFDARVELFSGRETTLRSSSATA